MITKTPILSREQWLEERKKTVGGSEIGAILGLNPYQSAYTLWAERTGQIKAFDGNLMTKVGTHLEDMVAQIFEEESGCKVHRTNFIYRNDRFPALHATPDRLLVGRKAGLECKTTSAFNAKKFRGTDFPGQYYAQAVQYMAVTELPEWFIAVLVVGTNEFHIYHLTRIMGQEKPDFCEVSLYIEDAEIETLAAMALEWLVHVQDRTPPSIDGSDSSRETLMEIYQEGVGGAVELFAREGALTRYEEIKEQIKALEDEKKGIENILCADLGDAYEGRAGRFRVTWKPVSRTTFDSKACLRDHPEMEVYQKLSLSRQFRVRC